MDTIENSGRPCRCFWVFVIAYNNKQRFPKNVSYVTDYKKLTIVNNPILFYDSNTNKYEKERTSNRKGAFA